MNTPFGEGFEAGMRRTQEAFEPTARAIGQYIAKQHRLAAEEDRHNVIDGGLV